MSRTYDSFYFRLFHIEMRLSFKIVNSFFTVSLLYEQQKHEKLLFPWDSRQHRPFAHHKKFSRFTCYSLNFIIHSNEYFFRHFFSGRKANKLQGWARANINKFFIFSLFSFGAVDFCAYLRSKPWKLSLKPCVHFATWIFRRREFKIHIYAIQQSVIDTFRFLALKCYHRLQDETERE